MAKKIRNLTTTQVDDIEAALFKLYRDEELVARGKPQLDIVQATGQPANPQITTAYVRREADPQNSGRFKLLVDAKVQALQGRTVTVNGKSVTINVAAAAEDNDPPPAEP